jgi:hypothetical protein
MDYGRTKRARDGHMPSARSSLICPVQSTKIGSQGSRKAFPGAGNSINQASTVPRISGRRPIPSVCRTVCARLAHKDRTGFC